MGEKGQAVVLPQRRETGGFLLAQDAFLQIPRLKTLFLSLEYAETLILLQGRAPCGSY